MKVSKEKMLNHPDAQLIKVHILLLPPSLERETTDLSCSSCPVKPTKTIRAQVHGGSGGA